MTRTVKVIPAASRPDLEGNQNLYLVEVRVGRPKPRHQKRRPARYKACGLVCAFCLIALFTSCGALTSVDSNPPIVITMTSGSPQSAIVGMAFAAPLTATVTKRGAPMTGASVTFTAPTTGASGTFARDAPSEIDITGAGGVAHSSTFQANTTVGSYTVAAAVTGAPTQATFAFTNAALAPPTITATGGTPQAATVGSAFKVLLVATVVDGDSNPVSGVSVTFTAPTAGASGTFANGMSLERDTTNASGAASSSSFTANPVAGGPYTVKATASGVAKAANFTLTNTVAVCQ
jgi:hypothetical protein